jgi:hypothetical protein
MYVPGNRQAGEYSNRMRLRASIQARGGRSEPTQTRVDYQHGHLSVRYCDEMVLERAFGLVHVEKAEVGSFSPMIRYSLCRLAVLTAVALTLGAQEKTQPGTEDKRILWIFTNHRTTDDSATLAKLTPRGKLAIAWGDATDRAIFFQTAFISGIGQATNGNPSFGQGIEGYARRFGTTYADFAIENVMTEGVFPGATASGPALLPPPRGHRAVETGLRDEPAFHHPHRFGKESIQLFRACRQRDVLGDL